jgi:hypothetical protein
MAIPHLTLASLIRLATFPISLNELSDSGWKLICEAPAMLNGWIDAVNGFGQYHKPTITLIHLQISLTMQ